MSYPLPKHSRIFLCDTLCQILREYILDHNAANINSAKSKYFKINHTFSCSKRFHLTVSLHNYFNGYIPIRYTHTNVLLHLH